MAPKLSQRNERRLAQIREAVAWKPGKKKQRAYEIWSDKKFKVELRKPGKEVLREGENHNPHDMRPVVTLRDDSDPIKDATFKQLFKELAKCKDKKVARALGRILVRMAEMSDHVDEKKGKWRYSPPEKEVITVAKAIPELHDVSLEAFLHYLDAIAWNEDVKYNREKEGKLKVTSSGRPNNVMTLVHVVAAIMGKIPCEEVMGELIARKGIAPLSKSRAQEIFG